MATTRVLPAPTLLLDVDLGDVAITLEEYPDGAARLRAVDETILTVGQFETLVRAFVDLGRSKGWV